MNFSLFHHFSLHSKRRLKKKKRGLCHFSSEADSDIKSGGICCQGLPTFYTSKPEISGSGDYIHVWPGKKHTYTLERPLMFSFTTSEKKPKNKTKTPRSPITMFYFRKLFRAQLTYLSWVYSGESLGQNLGRFIFDFDEMSSKPRGQQHRC